MCKWVCGWPLVLLLFSTKTIAQQPVVWQQVLGGSASDNAYALEACPGSTYVVAGSARSNDDQLEGKPSLDYDAWLVKINQQGQVLWQQLYGGSYNDEAKDVHRLADGGFILAGTTESKELTHGGRDVFVVRTDALGRQLWRLAYGGDGNDGASAIMPLPDGGFLVVGETGSNNGDVHRNQGGIDCWVLRLDAIGKLLWERTYGGPGNESVVAGIALADGYLLAAYTDSDKGDIPLNRGKTDLLLLRIGPSGNLYWKKTFGGTSFDEPHGLKLGQDGNYYVAGTTFSSDGDIQDHLGGGDAWLLCVDTQGHLVWNHCYGGSGDDGANNLQLLRGGQVLLVGTSRSRDGMRTVSRGVFDGWLVRTEPSGKVLWQQSLGGFGNDAFYAALATNPGEYLAVGASESRDGDLKLLEAHGSNDFWLAQLREPQAKTLPPTVAPTLLSGYVVDKTTQRHLSAEVVLVDNSAAKALQTIRTDSTGLYQVVLPRPTAMNVGVVAPGYMIYSSNLSFTNDQLGTEVRQDIELEPIQLDATVNLYNIYFHTGSPRLRPLSLPELDRLVLFLLQNRRVKIQINGHTDASGDNASKLQLSLLRAQEVKSYLQQHGITADRLLTQGYGATRPIADNETERGRALNRRVEIEIIGL